MRFRDSRKLDTASNRGSGHCHCPPSSLELCEKPTGQRAAAEAAQTGTGPAAGTAIVFLATRSPLSPLWYHTLSWKEVPGCPVPKCPPGTAIPSVHWNPAHSSCSSPGAGKLQVRDCKHPCDEMSSMCPPQTHPREAPQESNPERPQCPRAPRTLCALAVQDVSHDIQVFIDYQDLYCSHFQSF